MLKYLFITFIIVEITLKSNTIFLVSNIIKIITKYHGVNYRYAKQCILQTCIEKLFSK